VPFSYALCHVQKATTGLGVRRGRQAQIPLANFTVLRAGQEEIWRRLRHDALDAVRMASINAGVSVAYTEISRIAEKPVQMRVSRLIGERWRYTLRATPAAGILDIKDSYLAITSSSHKSLVI
jgi:hypothetical protein